MEFSSAIEETYIPSIGGVNDKLPEEKQVVCEMIGLDAGQKSKFRYYVGSFQGGIRQKNEEENILKYGLKKIRNFKDTSTGKEIATPDDLIKCKHPYAELLMLELVNYLYSDKILKEQVKN